MQTYILNCEKMTDKVTTHQYLQNSLQLPDYYGHNLDALADCLSEFSESTIILINSKKVKKNLGDYGETLICVFEDSCLINKNLHLKKM